MLRQRQRSTAPRPEVRRGGPDSIWESAMAHKQVLFRSAAREKILRGATQLADAVRVTLGPKSKSVLIQRKWGTPIVCNDGVTIAKEIELKDPEENLGAQMLRQAAEQTGDVVGDGTSTGRPSWRMPSSPTASATSPPGASAIDLKRGLDRGAKAAIEALTAMSRPVETRARRRRRSPRSPRTTTRRSASWSPMRWRRSATRA